MTHNLSIYTNVLSDFWSGGGREDATERKIRCVDCSQRPTLSKVCQDHCAKPANIAVGTTRLPVNLHAFLVQSVGPTR